MQYCPDQNLTINALKGWPGSQYVTVHCDQHRYHTKMLFDALEPCKPVL
jgi:hypothetical protein